MNQLEYEQKVIDSVVSNVKPETEKEQCRRVIKALKKKAEPDLVLLDSMDKVIEDIEGDGYPYMMDDPLEEMPKDDFMKLLWASISDEPGEAEIGRMILGHAKAWVKMVAEGQL